MVYTDSEQVFEAMKNGSLKYKSVKETLSRLRKQRNIEKLTIYLIGVELYKMWAKDNNIQYRTKGEQNDFSW